MRRSWLLWLVMVAVTMMNVPAPAAPETPAQQPSVVPAPGSEPPGHVSPRLNLTLEQRHVIKEIMKDVKEKPPSAADIKLHPMPAEVGKKVPQVKSHMFFLTVEQIVIVDPKDNHIADVINVGTD
jgi:hypothetical protein